MAALYSRYINEGWALDFFDWTTGANDVPPTITKRRNEQLTILNNLYYIGLHIGLAGNTQSTPNARTQHSLLTLTATLTAYWLPNSTQLLLFFTYCWTGRQAINLYIGRMKTLLPRPEGSKRYGRMYRVPTTGKPAVAGIPPRRTGSDNPAIGRMYRAATALHAAGTRAFARVTPTSRRVKRSGQCTLHYICVCYCCQCQQKSQLL